MNENLKINSINNYITRYDLKNEENHKNLEKVTKKKKKRIFYL